MTAACLEQKTMKYGFGRLIDLARAAQVAVSKHGRAVVVVVAVEEFERLEGRVLAAGKPGNTAQRAKVKKRTGRT